MECTASHLKHKKLTTDYGGRLTSASGRILLQSIPGEFCFYQSYINFLVFSMYWGSCLTKFLLLIRSSVIKKNTRFEGTELYRERLVRALARDLQVPVLVLDSSVLAPHVSLEFHFPPHWLACLHKSKNI